jgi:hypothetical protein
LVESESLDEKFRMDFYKSGTFEMRWGSRIGDSQERRWEKMAQSTTGKKVTARERARLAIAEGLAEELREQERIAAARETATTRFFEAEERRESTPTAAAPSSNSTDSASGTGFPHSWACRRARCGVSEKPARPWLQHRARNLPTKAPSFMTENTSTHGPIVPTLQAPAR